MTTRGACRVVLTVAAMIGVETVDAQPAERAWVGIGPDGALAETTPREIADGGSVLAMQRWAEMTEEFGPGQSLRPVDAITGEQMDRLESARRSGVLVTTDGGRWPGRAAIDVFAEESIAWRHDQLGVAEFVIDDLAAVAFDNAALSRVLVRDGATTDRVVLANGDVVEGFVLSLGESIVLERASGGELRVSRDGIAGIGFANPRTEAEGPRVWMDDGTVADLDRLEHEDGEWVFIRGEMVASMPVDRVVAATTDAALFAAMADLAVVGREPLDGLPVTPGLAIEAMDEDSALAESAPGGLRTLALDGPQRIVLALPENARAITATVCLPDAAPEWAEANVTLTAGDSSRTIVLGPGARRAGVTLEPEGADELTIELRSGRYGVRHTRAEIRRGMVTRDR